MNFLRIHFWHTQGRPYPTLFKGNFCGFVSFKGSVERIFFVYSGLLTKAIKERKLRYFGHLVRQRDHQRVLMEAKVAGKRGRGRSKTSWTDNIKSLFLYVIKILQYILRSTLLTRITLQYYWDKTPGEQEAVSTSRELEVKQHY